MRPSPIPRSLRGQKNRLVRIASAHTLDAWVSCSRWQNFSLGNYYVKNNQSIKNLSAHRDKKLLCCVRFSLRPAVRALLKSRNEKNFHDSSRKSIARCRKLFGSSQQVAAQLLVCQKVVFSAAAFPKAAMTKCMHNEAVSHMVLFWRIRVIQLLYLFLNPIIVCWRML